MYTASYCLHNRERNISPEDAARVDSALRDTDGLYVESVDWTEPPVVIEGEYEREREAQFESIAPAECIQDVSRIPIEEFLPEA